MKHKPPILIGIAIVCLAIVFTFDVRTLLTELIAWVQGLGVLGPIVYILLYILATVLFLPGSVLTLGAGFLFGVGLGTVVVSIAATIGATLAFLLGRFFLRDWVQAKVEGRKTFSAIDRAIGKQGGKIVLLMRLSPVFPFNLLNYSLGLTRIRTGPYVLASWIGMLPGTVLYVYLGSLAGDLAQLGKERMPSEWALLVVGLIATIAVVVYVTRIAQKALAEELRDSKSKRL